MKIEINFHFSFLFFLMISSSQSFLSLGAGTKKTIIYPPATKSKEYAPGERHRKEKEIAW